MPRTMPPPVIASGANLSRPLSGNLAEADVQGSQARGDVGQQNRQFM